LGSIIKYASSAINKTRSFLSLLICSHAQFSTLNIVAFFTLSLAPCSSCVSRHTTWLFAFMVVLPFQINCHCRPQYPSKEQLTFHNPFDVSFFFPYLEAKGTSQILSESHQQFKLLELVFQSILNFSYSSISVSLI